MRQEKNVIRDLFEKHIQHTPEKAIVTGITVFVCRFTKRVHSELGPALLSDDRVYVNARAIKHLYDKKPAEEFECLLRYAHIIIRFPDNIYRNKNPKRGDLCFVKTIKNQKYLCSLENEKEGLFIVTLFRLRKESYLNHFEHLWSWKDGIPSS